MVPGKKMKNEAVGNKMKKKEKGERKRGRLIFLLKYMAHFCCSLYINVTFHDPLRGKLAAGEKYKN